MRTCPRTAGACLFGLGGSASDRPTPDLISGEFRDGLQLPQPEEHTPAAGGELEKLLGAAHGWRAHHVDPASIGEVGAVGLEHPAGDVGAPDDLHVRAHATDDQMRCAGLLQCHVLGKKSAADAVGAAGGDRVRIVLGNGSGDGICAAVAGASASNGAGGDGETLRGGDSSSQ